MVFSGDRLQRKVEDDACETWLQKAAEADDLRLQLQPPDLGSGLGRFRAHDRVVQGEERHLFLPLRSCDLGYLTHRSESPSPKNPYVVLARLAAYAIAYDASEAIYCDLIRELLKLPKDSETIELQNWPPMDCRTRQPPLLPRSDLASSLAT